MTTVLVIDDDSTAARLLAAIAAPEGIEVVRYRIPPSTGPSSWGDGSAVQAVAAASAAGAAVPAAVESLFRLEGEYWTIGYAGHVIRLRDTKGLRYVAHLLRHPDQSVPAWELVGAIGNGASGTVATPHHAEELAIDARTRLGCKTRWAELEQDIAEAEAQNDLGRQVRARMEIERLTQYLCASSGRGGRTRRLPVAFERARQTVTKGIGNAVARIRSGNPGLGRHLATHIKTGYICTYRADPGGSFRWRF